MKFLSNCFFLLFCNVLCSAESMNSANEEYIEAANTDIKEHIDSDIDEAFSVLPSDSSVDILKDGGKSGGSTGENKTVGAPTSGGGATPDETRDARVAPMSPGSAAILGNGDTNEGNTSSKITNNRPSATSGTAFHLPRTVNAATSPASGSGAAPDETRDARVAPMSPGSAATTTKEEGVTNNGRSTKPATDIPGAVGNDDVSLTKDTTLISKQDSVKLDEDRPIEMAENKEEDVLSDQTETDEAEFDSLFNSYSYEKVTQTTVQILNKISGECFNFPVKVGDVLVFKKLRIRVYNCFKTPPTEKLEHIGFIEIWEVQDLKPTLIHSGWMFSNHSVNIMQDPEYDVRIVN